MHGARRCDMRGCPLQGPRSILSELPPIWMRSPHPLDDLALGRVRFLTPFAGVPDAVFDSARMLAYHPKTSCSKRPLRAAEVCPDVYSS
jgi:hypothetical protein